MEVDLIDCIKENFRDFNIIKKEDIPLIIINKRIAISILNPSSIEESINIINNLNINNRILFLVLYNEENLKFLEEVPNSFDFILNLFINNNKILNILPIFIYFNNCKKEIVDTLKELLKIKYSDKSRIHSYLFFQKICEKLDKYKLFEKVISKDFLTGLF